jgi:hypothetical protein
MYFNEKIVKIRYDLLRNKQNALRDYSEEEIFDFYDNCIPLTTYTLEKDGKTKTTEEEIHAKMPMADLIAHRLFYIMKDKKTKARRALLLPFLHER